MDFCISKNQSLDILKLADEILCSNSIKTLDKKFFTFLRENNKTLILEVNNQAINDLELIAKIQLEEKVNIVLKIFNLALIPAINLLKLRWFYFLPIKNFIELNWICGKGASYVYLDAPLSFDLDNVKEILSLYSNNFKESIKVRAIPNKPIFNQPFAFTDQKFYFYRSFWFRPEDIKIYDQYISVIEFIEPNQTREKKLFSIYKEEKYDDFLSFLIQPFSTGIKNSLVSDKLIKKRLNCNQKCFSLKTNCDDCSIFLNLAKIKTKNKEKSSDE